MEEVLEYLEMKNHYYEKFYSITEKFLKQAKKDQWEDMTFFVDNRERLLNIIRSLDHKIARVFKDAQISDREMNNYKSRVQKLMDKRKELGEKIVALDLQLISRIDQMKSDTIKDLKKSLETNQQLENFQRSAQIKRLKTQDVWLLSKSKTV